MPTRPAPEKFTDRLRDVQDLRERRGRFLLCRCTAGDLRSAVLADVLRRTAGLLGLRASLTAPSEDLLPWNVHPPSVAQHGHPAADVHVTSGAWSLPDADPLVQRLALLGVDASSPAHLTAQDLLAASDRLTGWRADVAAWAEEPSTPMCAEVQQDLLAALAVSDTVQALSVLDELATSEMPPGCRFETFAWADRLVGLDLARDVGR